jgi:WhiB family redox-sensing transcriptional regulator
MTDPLLDLIQRAGACRTEDPTLFFPPYDSPSANAPAKAVCERCPIKPECLEWALDHEDEGVWGGTGPADRRALLRKRDRVHCVMCGGDSIIEDENGHEICVSCAASWSV